jgi:hypothetical protein
MSHEKLTALGIPGGVGRRGGKTVAKGLPVQLSAGLLGLGSLGEVVASCPIVQGFSISQEYLLYVVL